MTIALLARMFMSVRRKIAQDACLVKRFRYLPETSLSHMFCLSR